VSDFQHSAASEIVRQLGFAYLLHVGRGRCLLPGQVPEWWRLFAGSSDVEFIVDDRQPFLLNFLVDAETFWQAGQAGSLPSGIWEHSLEDDESLLLAAHAMCRGPHCILLIEQVGSHSSSPTNVIRASRRVQLEMLRDIAVRQQIELELRNARDAALQLEQMKTRLLASTSHELRTPLANVIGMLEVALKSAAERNAHVEDAYAAARRLEQTLTALLDYAAGEAQQPQLRLEHLSMAQIVRELAGGFALAAAEKGLQLRIDIARQDVWLHSDRLRLQQIVNNLLDNAIRYTSDGSVTLAVRVIDDQHVELSVQDTGLGISAAEQELIFQPFERGTSAGGSRQGKGLGLAIVQDLVRALGGELALQSQLGQGSTFCVRLPLNADPSQVTRPTQPGPEPQVSATTEPAAPDFPEGLRVLVAEDNPVNRAYLVHVLRSVRCLVDEVDNGADMVRMALTHDYDLALTDCRMPDVDGLEAVRQIRQAEGGEKRRLPIVAITADCSGGAVQQFFDAGIDDILRKPVVRQEMFRQLARHLRPRTAPK
jgi:signal transduction histidine kinase/CheY-like chemotaxis protein